MQRERYEMAREMAYQLVNEIELAGWMDGEAVIAGVPPRDLRKASLRREVRRTLSAAFRQLDDNPELRARISDNQEVSQQAAGLVQAALKYVLRPRIDAAGEARQRLLRAVFVTKFRRWNVVWKQVPEWAEGPIPSMREQQEAKRQGRPFQPPREQEPYRVPARSCPNCGRVVSGMTAVGGDGEPGKPQPDDVSVCLYCGAMLMVVGEELHLRLLDRSDMDRMSRREREIIFAVQKQVLAVKQEGA